MKPLESPEYLARRAALDNVHRISRELHESYPHLGPFDEASALASIVTLEMDFMGASHIIALSLGEDAYMWKKERNPYFMDYATVKCMAYGLQTSPTLQKLMADAALRRLEFGPDATPSTADKIKRDRRKFQSITLMANLIFHGVPLHKAASKVAHWLKGQSGMKPMKASTLEKYYVEEFRQPGREKEYFDIWHRTIGQDIADAWKKIIEEMPDAPDFDLGARH